MNGLKNRWMVVWVTVVINLLTTSILLYRQRDIWMKPKAELPPQQRLWNFSAEDVDKFAAELRAERKKLETREGDVEKMAAQLAAEKEELNTVRRDIQATRDQLTAAIVEVEAAEVKNLKSLAQTYSNVSAASAVAILSEMDEVMAVKILSMMKTEKVGEIFQEMGRSQAPDGAMVKRAARMSDRLRLMKLPKKETQKL